MSHNYNPHLLINNLDHMNTNLPLPYSKIKPTYYNSDTLSTMPISNIENFGNSIVPYSNVYSSKNVSPTKNSLAFQNEQNFMSQDLNLKIENSNPKKLKTLNSNGNLKNFLNNSNMSLNFNGKIQNSKMEDMKYFNGNGTYLNNLMNSNIQNSINSDENHQNSENLKNSNSNECKKNLNLKTENSNLNTSANIVPWNDC